jgi:vacuolar-type H+-ATPase subunit H
MGESDRTNSPTRVETDLHEAGDDVEEAGERAADKVGDAADRAKDEASRAGHKLSDAVEDVIPGDSDGDGH